MAALRPDRAKQSDAISFVVVFSNESPDLMESCLKSIRDQVTPIDEIVIVDNASPDGIPRSIVAHLQCAVVTRRLRPAFPVPEAKNAGWRAATRPWIYFVDGDDELAPKSVEELRRHLSSSPADFFFGDYTVEAPRQPTRTVHTGDLTSNGQLVASRLMADWKILGCSIFSRDALECVDGFCPSAVIMEDVDLFLRLLQAGRVGEHVPHKLYVWKRRTGSRSARRSLRERCRFWSQRKSLVSQHLPCRLLPYLLRIQIARLNLGRDSVVTPDT